ncbi:hypothetical protein VSR01_10615 [Actinacidiphila sp. DG2A-62]|uniref:hypothetical protein n=1 Tax=Actinacidiphila sp. DG2A-62 TaxID=3108821 RepID=UPI002DC01784|nr:hypothetical protein [Actinacidiphila sp. DG2A-62]MEC3993970.1 hypothetical protein [Actinacidiphila sp. DG2A-62]
MTHETTALLGASLGLGGTALAVVSRYWPRPRTGPAPLAVVVMAYRHCPIESRTRPVIIHADGTATCGDCHTLIPADTEEVPRA